MMSTSFAAAAALAVFCAVVIATLGLVVWPTHLRLPGTWCGRTGLRIQVSYCWMPVVGVVLLLACTSTSPTDVGRALKGSGHIQPLGIVVLFMSMAYIAASLDNTGLFAWTAHHTNRLSKGRGHLLFVLYTCLSAALTATTGNDTSIMCLTPIVIYFAKAAGCDPLPYLMTLFVASNTWSMLLFVGNPTNIIVQQAAQLTFLGYTKWMALPTIATGLVGGLQVYLTFRGGLTAQLELPEQDAGELLTDRVGAVFGTTNLAACLVLLALAPTLVWDMWLITLVCAILHAVYNLVALVGRDQYTGEWLGWEGVKDRLFYSATRASSRAGTPSFVYTASGDDEREADEILARELCTRVLPTAAPRPKPTLLTRISSISQKFAALSRRVSRTGSIGRPSDSAGIPAAAGGEIVPDSLASTVVVVNPGGAGLEPSRSLRRWWSRGAGGPPLPRASSSAAQSAMSRGNSLFGGDGLPVVGVPWNAARVRSSSGHLAHLGEEEEEDESQREAGKEAGPLDVGALELARRSAAGTGTSGASTPRSVGGGALPAALAAPQVITDEELEKQRRTSHESQLAARRAMHAAGSPEGAQPVARPTLRSILKGHAGPKDGVGGRKGLQWESVSDLAPGSPATPTNQPSAFAYGSPGVSSCGGGSESSSPGFAHSRQGTSDGGNLNGADATSSAPQRRAGWHNRRRSTPAMLGVVCSAVGADGDRGEACVQQDAASGPATLLLTSTEELQQLRHAWRAARTAEQSSSRPPRSSRFSSAGGALTRAGSLNRRRPGDDDSSSPHGSAAQQGGAWHPAPVRSSRLVSFDIVGSRRQRGRTASSVQWGSTQLGGAFEHAGEQDSDRLLTTAHSHTSSGRCTHFSTPRYAALRQNAGADFLDAEPGETVVIIDGPGWEDGADQAPGDGGTPQRRGAGHHGMHDDDDDSPQQRGFIDTVLSLPWEVVPFILGMFVVVEGLRVQGWLASFEPALAGTLGPAVWKCGLLSVALCAVLNNQPMTILLATALLEPGFKDALARANGQPALAGGPADPVTEHVYQASLFALVVGSNVGALWTLIGALAGLMWANILRRMGVAMSYVRFMVLMLPLGITCTVTALLVLWAEFSVTAPSPGARVTR